MQTVDSVKCLNNLLVPILNTLGIAVTVESNNFVMVYKKINCNIHSLNEVQIFDQVAYGFFWC